LLAGNGRLIAPRTLPLVAAAAVGVGLALVGDDVSVGVDENSAPRLPCASPVCVAA
jgi:hypothetical protein